MLCRRGKYLASAGIRNPNRPTRSLITASIALLQLPIMNIRIIKLRCQNNKGNVGEGGNNNRSIDYFHFSVQESMFIKRVNYLRLFLCLF